MTCHQRNQILRRRRQARLRRRHRRGVLLLVVLSMLVLFMMIGTAFLMTSDMYRKGSKAAAKEGRVGNPPRELLDRALYQLLRDTNNQFSVVRYHSLLRDMYGTDGFEATAALAQFAMGTGPNSSPDPTQGQFIDIVIDQQSDVWKLHRTIDNLPIGHSLPPINGYYNGTLLTFTSGPARNQSFRVLQYKVIANNQQYWLRLMAVPHANMTVVNPPGQLAGHSFIVNGRPYNGTGVGYNLTAMAGTARLSAMAAILPSLENSSFYAEVALTPNSVSFSTLPANVESLGDNVTSLAMDPENILVDYGHYPGVGGCDESYDAPDFQNMFLAHETVMPVAKGSWENHPTAGPIFALENVPIPSFHRMAMVNYWRKKVLDAGLDPDSALAIALKRKIMMRPLREDHPNFDGSNPQSHNTPYWEIVGPWDVDNDNDGVPDSIFVDLGDPVQQAEDGTLYKPLYAIKIIDLDSRLNVNAHGTAEHVFSPVFDPASNLLAGTAMGTPVSNDQMPHGIGYGTPEISLRPVFPAPYNQPAGNRVEVSLNNGSRDPTVQIDDYAALLWGRASSVPGLAIGGRYGFLNHSTSPGFQVTPGINYDSNTVPDSVMPDPLAQLKFFDHPLSIVDLSAFGSPPDLKGRYAGGLDHFGQPVSEAHNDSSSPYLLANSPYELNLSSSSRRGTWDNPQHASYNTSAFMDHQSLIASDDAPFATAELERLLRAYDADAGTIPSRLWELVDAFDPDKLIYNSQISSSMAMQSVAQQQAAINRRLVTTDSYDMPVPGGNLEGRLALGADGIRGTPDDYENLMGGQPVPMGARILDLLRYRIQYERFRQDLPLLTSDSQFDSLSQNLLAPEVLAGHRMDLNRPFGNGQDDNGNGVVDDPGEAGEHLWNPNDPGGSSRLNAASSQPRLAALAQTGGVPFDYTNGVTVNGNPTQLARQLYARHLYVLMMLLVDENYMVERDLSCANDEFWLNKIKRDGDSEESLRRKLTARRIAQWAINCVDFRDADAIMTPFEYDDNPFDEDGWNVDGDPSTDEGSFRGLAWGAERPELLITETFAYHDRRCTDEQELQAAGPDSKLNHEFLKDSKTDDEIPADDDLDQRYKPRGTLFVELYNPWTGNAQTPMGSAQTPAEFYPIRTDPELNNDEIEYRRKNGVQLDRLSNKRTGHLIGSPVWRMVVARDTCSGRLSDPVDRTPGGGNLEKIDPTRRMLDFDGFGVDPDKAGERYVYFVSENNRGLIPPHAPPQPGTMPLPRAHFVTSDYQDALAPIKPGRYAVIGPSGIPMDNNYQPAVQGGAKYFVNPLSRLEPGNGPDKEQRDSQHIGRMQQTRRIELRPNSDPEVQQLLVDDNGGGEFRAQNGTYVNATENGSVSPCVAIPIENLNISEPVEGYPSNRYRELHGNLGEGPFANPRIDRMAQTQFGEVKYQTVYDTPFDMEFDLVRNGTIANYRTIHLQRLANPLLSWNQHTNPYLTVDSMSVDLTAFNGMNRAAETFPNEELIAAGDNDAQAKAQEIFDAIPKGAVLQGDYFAPLSATELANAPDHVIEELINIMSRADPRPTAAEYRQRIRGNPTAFNRQLERLETARRGEINSRSNLFETDNDGQWGWHRIQRPLPDKEITFGGRQGDFRQRMHLKSLERGSHHRQVYKAADKVGWAYDPAWQPRLLWKQEPPNRTIVSDRKKFSDLVNVLDGDLLRGRESGGDELTPAERKKNKQIVNEIDSPPHVFDFVMQHTLGFINESYATDMNMKVNTDEPKSQALRPVDMTKTNTEFGEAPWAVLNNQVLDNPVLKNENISVVPADDSWVPGNTKVLTHKPGLTDPQKAEEKKFLRRQFRPEAADATFLNLDTIPPDPGPSSNNRENQKRENQPINPDNEGQRLAKMLGSTFPAFPWNNRPFVSQMELLQVPASSSSMLLRDYSVINDDSPNPYNPVAENSQGDDAVEDPKQKLARQRAPNGHLLNFLQTTPPRNMVTNNSSATAPNYHRLLEFVHVPSRFVQTETVLDPVESSGLGLEPIQDATDPRVRFQPPYNKVSNYRETGRVNLNTVSGRRDGISRLGLWSEVYDGIMHRLRDSQPGVQGTASHLGPAWRDVVRSRQGYITYFSDPTIPDPPDRWLNPNFPTSFANPFRATGTGDLVPLESMVQPGVNAGLLRAHPYNQGADRTWGPRVNNMVDVKPDDPLYGHGRTVEAGTILGTYPIDDEPCALNALISIPNVFDPSTSQSDKPLFSESVRAPHIDAERNPHFFYQPLTRLGNLTTTRSGVFAVWITVAYFEVEPAPAWNELDPNTGMTPRAKFGGDGGSRKAELIARALYDHVYPEGYQLGQEVGIETGNTRRHRGFYIVDRTLPVGFKPGEDLNVENMIRLRRRIE